LSVQAQSRSGTPSDSLSELLLELSLSLQNAGSIVTVAVLGRRGAGVFLLLRGRLLRILGRNKGHYSSAPPYLSDGRLARELLSYLIHLSHGEQLDSHRLKGSVAGSMSVT